MLCSELPYVTSKVSFLLLILLHILSVKDKFHIKKQATYTDLLSDKTYRNSHLKMALGQCAVMKVQ